MSIAPPRPRPAPLNALRAFEAAARLGGFRAAADELCVTPGAVAQQVKSLEAWAGAPLFNRNAQGVTLTTLGAAVSDDFSAAFDLLGRASGEMRRRGAPETVRIAALPSVAQLWLSPRLPALRAEMATMAISVTAMERPPNLLREPFDLAIFFEPAPGAGRITPLAPDEITPVAAPNIAARLRRESDLAREVLLTDAAWADDWAIWAPGLGAGGGPVHSLYALAVEEAVNDGGVLIGHLPLVERHLTSGALVAPFARRQALGRDLTLSVAGGRASGGALENVIAALSDST